MKNKTHCLFKLLIVTVMAYLAVPGAVLPASSGVYQKGEMIVYDIKKLGIKVGEASLLYQGPTRLEGRDMVLIIFTSRAMNFFDEEKIYLDPVRMIPLIVDRDLNIFGKKEKIREIYDQQNGTIKIIKNARGKVTELTIEKNVPIENIYGFLYRYRKTGTFMNGETFTMNLPTKDVTISLTGKTKVATALGEANAYYLESSPREYGLWFQDDAGKIPLRIDGAMGIGKASLILKSYQAAHSAGF